MSLIVVPDDGVGPIISAINKAKKSVDIGIFRLDRNDIAKALRAAVARGVPVRTLIAHTNRGGEKKLRKLEQDLLQTGASVRRTDDDLHRYHNKIMIVDRATLYVLGFNYTATDIDKSRSFGVVIKKRELVLEALKLFEADSLRQPYKHVSKAFIVSPVNAREQLAVFLRGARKQLLVYDPQLTDPKMIRILQERVAAGVSVRILGRLAKRGAGLTAEKFPGKRLHVRAIVRDGQYAFVGSQGLRKLELDGRREVGVIVRERKVVTRMVAVFEADWAETDRAKQDVKDAKRDEKTEAVIEGTSEAKIEAKAEAQEAEKEAKIEAKVEAKAEAKEAEKEAKVEAKAEAKEAQKEAKVEAKEEAKEAKKEAKIEAKVEAKAEAREAKVEAKAEEAKKVEAKVEAKEAKAEAKEAKKEAKVEAKAEAKAEKKAEAKEAKVEAKEAKAEAKEAKK